MAVIEAKLADSKARKEKAVAAIEGSRGLQAQIESQIQDLQQKVSKYRDQMLGVKTNQEYKALTTEVEFAQQHIREAEDKILEGMLATESQEKDLKTAEAELKAEAAEIEKEKAEARSRTEVDEGGAGGLERQAQHVARGDHAGCAAPLRPCAQAAGQRHGRSPGPQVFRLPGDAAAAGVQRRSHQRAVHDL